MLKILSKKTKFTKDKKTVTYGLKTKKASIFFINNLYIFFLIINHSDNYTKNII